MKTGLGWKKWAVGAVLALALVISAGALVGRVASAQGGGPGGVGAALGHWGGVEWEALLAQALGISVEELQQAEQQADEAAIAQMQANGDITAEQADLMLAQRKVRSYLDRDSLVAAALGITVEELQAAREAGKTERDLMTEKGIDEATFRSNLKTARDKAIDQAVADGVITEAQATALKAAGGFGDGPGMGPGPGMGEGPGGRGGRRGPGTAPGGLGQPSDGASSDGSTTGAGTWGAASSSAGQA